MSEPFIERALKRDRWIVLGALAAAGALSWLYVVWLAQNGMAPMPGMPDMPNMAMNAGPPSFAFLFAMWAVMMIGMMTPSAAPMILIYARVGRSAAAQGQIFAPTFWFALGYAIVWLAFSLIAAAAQLMLQQAALMTPMMRLAAPTAGAIVLIAAGLYQWTPLKNHCLSHCRAPLNFVMQHGGFKPEASASVRMGLLHGLYCLGCCWSLMLVLFAAGIMDLLWIAGLAILVLAEKVAPGGKWIARVSGVALIGVGAWMLWRGTSLTG